MWNIGPKEDTAERENTKESQNSGLLFHGGSKNENAHNQMITYKLQHKQRIQVEIDSLNFRKP